MLTYSLLLLILLLFVSLRLRYSVGYANSSIKNIYPGYWLGVTIVILVIGLRDGGGVDYQSYVRIFETLGSDFYTREKLERGYYYFNWLIKTLGLGSEYVIFFAFFITFLFIALTIKRYSDSYVLSYLTLFATEVVFIVENLVRQGIAIALCFYSIKYILEKRFLSFLLIVSIASLFHKTAILFYITYFLVIKLDRFFLLLLYFLSLYFLYDNSLMLDLVSLVDSHLFGNRYYHLLILLYGLERDISNKVLIFNMFAIFLFLTYKKEWLNDILSLFLFNVFIFMVILSNLFSGFLDLNRFVLYYSIFFTLSFPHFFNIYLNRTKLIRWVFYIIFLILFSVMYARVLLNDGNKILPYSSFIF